MFVKLLKPMLLVSILGLSLWAGFGRAQAQEPIIEPIINPADQSCADCHIDIAQTMQGSPHALAYQNPIFQAALASTADNSNCLSCHTTGFSLRTGAFTHEGVTCEACHGQTPATHPQDPILPAPSIEVCADCHLPTYHEWQLSAHSEVEVACSTCHNPHPQTLRAESNQALCITCHATETLVSNFAHDVHAEEDCAACHWHENVLDVEVHIVTGAIKPTGHDGIVEPLSCENCHRELDGQTRLVSAPSLTHPQPLLEAQVRIQELESRRATVQAQRENTIMLRIIQGLMIGAIIGAAGVTGYYQTRRRR